MKPIEISDDYSVCPPTVKATSVTDILVIVVIVAFLVSRMYRSLRYKWQDERDSYTRLENIEVRLSKIERGKKK